MFLVVIDLNDFKDANLTKNISISNSGRGLKSLKGQ
jgi:hypothetical protein